MELVSAELLCRSRGRRSKKQTKKHLHCQGVGQSDAQFVSALILCDYSLPSVFFLYKHTGAGKNFQKNLQFSFIGFKNVALFKELTVKSEFDAASTLTSLIKIRHLIILKSLILCHCQVVASHPRLRRSSRAPLVNKL